MLYKGKKLCNRFWKNPACCKAFFLINVTYCLQKPLKRFEMSFFQE